MSENSLPENPDDSFEEQSADSSVENFTLSNFNTAAVFGDSLVKFLPEEKPQFYSALSNDFPPQASYISTENIICSAAPNIQKSPCQFCLECGTQFSVGETFCGMCGEPRSEIHLQPNSTFNENSSITQSSISIPSVTCNGCGLPNPAYTEVCFNCNLKLPPLPSSQTFPSVGEQIDETTNVSQNRQPYSNEKTVPLPLNLRPDNFEQETAEEAVNFEIGSILGNRYKILLHLGEGGFGDIYKVENIKSYFSDVEVLKLVYTRIAQNYSMQSAEELREYYCSQYKAWKILSEKEPDYIVRIRDVTVVERRVGLLMEYMEGGTLLELVESWGGKPQTQEQLQHLIKLFIQASRALQTIHKYKLIHCDVKPHNFLLDAAKKRCKLCDFELLTKKEKATEQFPETEFGSDKSSISGTLNYMAPEALRGEFSYKSDIYSLGVSFYYLLSGEHPVNPAFYYAPNYSLESNSTPLTELNSLVSPTLDRLVQWCIEPEPGARPDSVADLLHRLIQLGISDEESNFSPVNLARLLLNHLSPIDLDWLIDHLQMRGFRSMSDLPEFQRQDMIEEYCYTTSPFEILKEHCTGASLYAIAAALKIDKEKRNREDLIKKIVDALGFLEGRKQAHGLESIRRDLESSRIKFESAETIAECRGHLDHAFAEVERAVGLMIRFYGQTLYGNGLTGFLSKKAKGKRIDKMTLGEKVGALREICKQKPNAPLPERVERIFSFPLIKADIFSKLDNIVTQRNQVTHHHLSLTALHAMQNFGQEILGAIVEIIKDLAANPYAPRVVQITSLQNDVFGRHFYEGFDEKGKKEKIFTTFGLQVGQLYWFVPLTNPARINPLIFPFEEPEESSNR